MYLTSQTVCIHVSKRFYIAKQRDRPTALSAWLRVEITAIFADFFNYLAQKSENSRGIEGGKIELIK